MLAHRSKKDVGVGVPDDPCSFAAAVTSAGGFCFCPLGQKLHHLYYFLFILYYLKKHPCFTTRVLSIYLLLPNIHVHRLRDPLDAAGACVLPYIVHGSGQTRGGSSAKMSCYTNK